MSTNTLASPRDVLKSAGYKATPGRIALLAVLSTVQKPLSAHTLAAQLHREMNQATVYRALEALVERGVLRRVDFGHAHAHYELAQADNHHHHLICKRCGVVEDVSDCGFEALEKTVLKKSKKFGRITAHSFEFFGLCSACLKK